MELDGSDAVAKIDKRGRGVLLDYAVPLLRHRDGPYPLRNFQRLVTHASKVEVALRGGRFFIFGVPRCATAGQELVHVCGDRTSFFLHTFDRWSNTGGIPHLERSHLPVKAG